MKEGVIISLGIILYGYAFFELIPSVEDNMKNRPQLGQAMAWTFLIAAMINVPFSILAFLWFGVLMWNKLLSIICLLVHFTLVSL